MQSQCDLMTLNVPLSFLTLEEFPTLSRVREIIISTRSVASGPCNRQHIPDGRLMVASLTNLGIIFSDSNRLSEAEEILMHAIKIQECTNHAMHPDLLRPLITLGVVLARQRHFAKAETTFLRALTIVGKADSRIEEHRLTLLNLIYVYHEQNRTETESQMREYLARLLGENPFVIKDRHSQPEE
jgi:hypothetical protein